MALSVFTEKGCSTLLPVITKEPFFRKRGNGMDTPTKIYTITCSCGNREEVCISSKFWAMPDTCINCGAHPYFEVVADTIPQNMDSDIVDGKATRDIKAGEMISVDIEELDRLNGPTVV